MLSEVSRDTKGINTRRSEVARGKVMYYEGKRSSARRIEVARGNVKLNEEK